MEADFPWSINKVTLWSTHQHLQCSEVRLSNDCLSAATSECPRLVSTKFELSDAATELHFRWRFSCHSSSASAKTAAQNALASKVNSLACSLFRETAGALADAMTFRPSVTKHLVKQKRVASLWSRSRRELSRLLLEISPGPEWSASEVRRLT